MHITGVYIIINDMLTSPDCFRLLIKQQNMDITCQYSLREEGNAAVQQVINFTAICCVH